MQSETNPYAVSPLSSDSATEPIHFGGSLNRDDLLISLRDSAPRSRISLVHYVGRIFLICGLLWVSVSIAPISSIDFKSILWPLLAYPLLPVWLWFARFLAPGDRRRRRRLEESAKHCMPNYGWMDQEHLVLYDDSMFFRARWSVFGPALLIDRHLLLPTAANTTYRTVLPIRFFLSPIDAKQGIDLVDHQCGYQIKQPPSDNKLPELVQSEGYESAPHRIDETMAWDATNWPFESSGEDEQVFSLEPSARQKHVYLLRGVRNILLYGLWYFLPIWGTTVGWLLLMSDSTSNWSFLLDQKTVTALVVLPAILCLTFFTFNAAFQISKIRQSQSQTLLIQIRQAGIHLSNANFESWFRWSAVDKVISRKNEAGWIPARTKEETAFTRFWFESEQDFQRFKTALAQLDHSGEV
ncbi:MAG: hypothetical protein GY904_28000 [Planctomycetaceae bacterium]|nr:hypothetical protein [Planctomycetaceae bacterium]